MGGCQHLVENDEMCVAAARSGRARTFTRAQLVRIVLLSCMGAGRSVSAAEDPGEITIGRIVEDMESARGRIQGFEVRYTHSERGVSAKREGRPIDTTHVVEFAFDGRGFMKTQRDVDTRHDDKEYVIHSERPRLCFDGEIFRKHWIEQRIVAETPVGSAGSLDVGMHCEYLGELAFSRPVGGAPDKTSQEQSFFLPSALAHWKYDIVRTEPVDGVECFVLQRTESEVQDVIWLHRETDWTLRKRVMQHRPDPNRQDSRLVSLFQDYRETDAGVWLPWRIETQASRRKRDSEEFVPITAIRMQVEHLSVNRPLDRSVFSATLAPGTIVKNGSAGTQNILPGGEDILEDAVEQACSRYGWRSRADSASARPVRSLRVGMAVGGALLGATLTWVAAACCSGPKGTTAGGSPMAALARICTQRESGDSGSCAEHAVHNNRKTR